MKHFQIIYLEEFTPLDDSVVAAEPVLLDELIVDMVDCWYVEKRQWLRNWK